MALRILYPVTWPVPTRRASDEQSVNTVAALARQGHAVTLVLPRRRGDAKLDAPAIREYFRVAGDFRVAQRPARWTGDNFAAAALWLRSLFRDQRIHEHDLLLTRIPPMLVMGAGSPLPFTFDHYRRWPDDLPWLRPLIRRTARQGRCAGIIVHSGYAADSYRRWGVGEEKLLVAHNGFPPELLGAALELDAAREAVGLTRDRPTAVYAGRVNGRKGLDQLLALAGLRPAVHFVLVGSEGEGAIEQAARSLANVTVVGWQAPDRLAPWLRAADVLIIPASAEPRERYRDCVMPMKVFAYLAAGRPILAPMAPDTAELLEHEVNALLVPPGEPAATAAGLDRLLADRALARRLGEAGMDQARDHSWDSRGLLISGFLERRLCEMRRSGAVKPDPLEARA